MQTRGASGRRGRVIGLSRATGRDQCTRRWFYATSMNEDPNRGAVALPEGAFPPRVATDAAAFALPSVTVTEIIPKTQTIVDCQ